MIEMVYPKIYLAFCIPRRPGQLVIWYRHQNMGHTWKYRMFGNSNTCWWYWDGADNTIEENSGVFSLIWMH